MTKPTSPLYGTWIVRTDNDEEGRTTKILGTFEGWLDDVVLGLADKVFYNLYVERVVASSEPMTPTRSKVSVYLPRDLIGSESPANLINRLLADAGRLNKTNAVGIGRTSSVTFQCVNLTDEEIAQSRARNSGLAKLTDEEKKALGL